MFKPFLCLSACTILAAPTFARANPNQLELTISCLVYNQEGVKLDDVNTESSIDTEGNNAYSGTGATYKYFAFKKEAGKSLFEIFLLDMRSGKQARSEASLLSGQTLTLHLDGLAKPITTTTLKCTAT